MRRLRLRGWIAFSAAWIVVLACNPLSLADQGQGLATQAARAATEVIAASTQAAQTEAVAATQAQSTRSAASRGTPSGEQATDTPEASEGTETPIQPLSAKVGQRAVVGGGVAVTVLGTETSKGSGDVKPAEGNTFLLVHLSLENVSPSNNINWSIDEFQVKDSTGKLEDSVPLGFVDDELEDGNYAPGGKVTATVGFEVGLDQKGFHLLYDYNDQSLDVTLAE